MKKYLGLCGVIFAAALSYQLLPLSTSNAEPAQGPAGKHQPCADTIVQIAPLDQLSRGGFDGTTTVAEVVRKADFGIGTFNGLDGEMIMLDGVVYQAPSSGIPRAVSPQELIPFATLAWFHAEKTFRQTTPLSDYASLQAFLSASMPDQNQVLALKVHGTFSYIKLRAPQKQVQPYPTLTEALKTQAIFERTNIKGTAVGFRFPAYFGTANAAGYHFHFISDDRKHAGHILEVASTSFVASVETIEQYNLTLAPGD